MKKIMILILIGIFLIPFITARDYELVVIPFKTYIDPTEDIIFHVRIVGEGDISGYSFLKIFSEPDTSFSEISLCTGENINGEPIEKCEVRQLKDNPNSFFLEIGGDIIKNYFDSKDGIGFYKITLSTSDKIRSGDHKVYLTFQHKDEEGWHVTKAESYFHVKTYYEKNQEWINWISYLGVIIAFITAIFLILDSETFKKIYKGYKLVLLTFPQTMQIAVTSCFDFN